RVGARRRQLEPELCGLLAQEAIRHLDQDAGAVPGLGIAAAGPAVLEPLEHLDALVDQLVRLLAADVRHEPDAAGVSLLRRIVESLAGRKSVTGHGRLLSEAATIRRRARRSCAAARRVARAAAAAPRWRR